MTIDDTVRKSILKRLAKASDSRGKADAFDEVDWESQGPALMTLIRDGSINIGQDPYLWELLARKHDHVAAEDLLDLLRNAAKVPKQFVCPHLPFWPRELDLLCMNVALRAEERAKLLAGLGDLPTNMRVGLAWCLARFGEPVAKALGNQASALAKQDVINEPILWPTADGKLEARGIWNFETHRPTDTFGVMLELLTTPEKYEQALYQRVIKQALKRRDKPAEFKLDYARMASVFRRASETEWPLLVRLSFPGLAVLQVRLEERQDFSGEVWMRIAEALTKDSKENSYIAEMRNFIVAFAATRFAAQDGSVPDSVVEALELHDGFNELSAAFDSEVRYEGPTDCYPGLEPIFDALMQLDDDQRSRVIANALNRAPTDSAYPYLQLVHDAELIERAIACFDKQMGSADQAAFGLGHLDASWLPRLVQAADAAESPRTARGLRQAVLVLLAREVAAGRATAADYDRFIRPHLGTDSPECTAFEKVLLHLPEERSEPIVLALLKTGDSAAAARAIAVCSWCWTERVRAALVECLVSDARKLSNHDAYVAQGLRNLPEGRKVIEEILRRDPTTALDWSFGSALGFDTYDQLKASLNEGAPSDEIARLCKTAEKAAGDMPIYALRRLKGPDTTTLNRVGGLPPGDWTDRWPERDSLQMTHLFTIDLQDVPAGDFGDKRLLTLFCASPHDNEACYPDTDYTAVVFSSNDELGVDSSAPEGVPTIDERAFKVIEIRVPEDTWTNPEYGDLRHDLGVLSARIFGPPSWIQRTEEDDDVEDLGRFIMQFNEDFCDVNLGDSGRMYVFEDLAYWECY